MKPSSLLLASLLSATVVLFSGCATAFSTNEYTVNIRTPDAPGQEFTIVDSTDEFIYKGTTPDIVALRAQSRNKTREEYVVRYGNDQEIEIKATITPIYWANILNLIGFAVDAATGTMWSLPGHIDLENFEQDNSLINTNL